MALSYLQYDVFTHEPLTGNQLAVFLDGRGLSVERMQAIAKEMNFSESTFILPAEAPGTDVRMRIFTPGTELPMAGHPTIGSTFALAHTGVIKPGAKRFVFGLGVGPTPVDLEWKDNALKFAWMTQLRPTFDPPIEDRAGVAAAIGLSADDLAAYDLPVQQVSCGLKFVMIPLRDQATVDRAEADLPAFKKFVASAGLERDACLMLFAPSHLAPSHPRTAAKVYSRMFAPGFGIPEDPATGGAAGPLGCYLVRHGLVSGDAAQRIVNDQGVFMGRPSRIHMAISGTADEITQVKVGGEAVLVGRGELLVE